ncbi:hypothetical protein [Aphanothece sacrum]|uniref:Glycosyltransferase RgtA/B/C/D-like domain-containing protein n=1 Tax=Aphanothece sacrum FPU1 TaxID=1920663 RepID=A0A401IM12_APHSA|nr:hypothetical protein [Aphanothece sacrum]GBF82287.1 hypothetical protein AsFPU1_3715 [Aphanothece sacrum FPU1]GBF84188.1 hypothetical protein AsFPU3_1235 [Aphanothece sacrum FPU3]
MLIPLASLAIGCFILSLTLLTYIGLPLLKNIPVLFKLKSQPYFGLGSSLISLTLMLGIIGYFGYIDGQMLRTLRFVMGGGGIILMTFPVAERLKYSEKFGKYIAPYLNIKTGLTFISIITLFSIFLISFFDGNYGGDGYMYHLPFAARIWGIISPEQYTFEDYTEHRFLGFPLLANALQGFFWKIFQRPEATNLVCFSSLIILITYLTNSLKIPFYLATISLLAIPMVHMHAARSYIDLPGNVCVSILILTTYLLYINKISFNNKTLLIIFLSAASAANIKFQLIPVVFIILCFIFPQIISKYWKPDGNAKTGLIRLIKVLSISFLATLVIFVTPIRNILVYHNPFYPVKIEIAGHIFNHNEAPPDFMHANLRKLPPTLRWAKSVLEINAFDKRRPWPWTLAMDFISWDEEAFGIGGYFGGYVIFNLLLFIYLCWKIHNHESKIAIFLMVIMTGLTSIMPQSYELRYYMYWMIVFVSLNAYLISQHLNYFSENKLINSQNFALVATGFMLVFILQTDKFFTIPKFEPLSRYIQGNVQTEILDKIKDGEKVCLVGKTPHSFFYSSYFHPSRNYSLKSEFEISPKYSTQKCKGRTLIR